MITVADFAAQALKALPASDFRRTLRSRLVPVSPYARLGASIATETNPALSALAAYEPRFRLSAL